MTDIASHYRLLAAALPKEEKRIRSSYMPTLVLVVVLSTVVFLALGISKGATSRSMILYGFLMVASVAYLAVWYPRRMRRRLFKCWETYDLEIGGDYLLRRQSDIPDLRLQFDEVQAVEHVQGRYLRVIGKTKSRAISIPESQRKARCAVPLGGSSASHRIGACPYHRSAGLFTAYDAAAASGTPFCLE
jgi:hypothetical protein